MGVGRELSEAGGMTHLLRWLVWGALGRIADAWLSALARLRAEKGERE